MLVRNSQKWENLSKPDAQTSGPHGKKVRQGTNTCLFREYWTSSSPTTATYIRPVSSWRGRSLVQNEFLPCQCCCLWGFAAAGISAGSDRRCTKIDRQGFSCRYPQFVFPRNLTLSCLPRRGRKPDTLWYLILDLRSEQRQRQEGRKERKWSWSKWRSSFDALNFELYLVMQNFMKFFAKDSDNHSTVPWDVKASCGHSITNFACECSGVFAVLLRRINNPNFAIHPQRLSVKFLICNRLPAIYTVLKFKLFVFDKNTIHILHETAEVHMSRCFDLALLNSLVCCLSFQPWNQDPQPAYLRGCKQTTFSCCQVGGLKWPLGQQQGDARLLSLLSLLIQIALLRNLVQTSSEAAN